MRAMLLAAGLGTRLRPLTNTIPKCLVPIKGQALLGIWIERLSHAGISHILINTCYMAEQVHEYVASHQYRDKVTLVAEAGLKGTAGTLLDNLEFFDGKDGLLIHADNYWLGNFKDLIQAHLGRPPCCLMTMMVFQSDNPQSCGIVQLDRTGIVVEFHEKQANPPGNLANCAVYLVSPELINYLASDFRGVSDFSTEVLPKLVGRIFAFETREFFLDIGTPEAYKKANTWKFE